MIVEFLFFKFKCVLFEGWSLYSCIYICIGVLLKEWCIGENGVGFV